MRARIAAAVGALVVPVASIAAQCGFEWQAAGRFPGADGHAFATAMWDPDGPGPAAARVVVGGAFTVLADAVANHVAALDVAADQWSPFGTGTNGPVRAVLALPNGDLVVGGTFQIAGGVAAANVARWNGTAWQPLSAGLAGTVHALALLPGGDVVAGGEFTTTGGLPATRIARWNGSSWQDLAGGCSDTVHALAVASNGDLIAGGDFLTAGGQAAVRIARWSNAAWSTFGAGCNDRVRAIAVLASGDVVAAGTFTQAGGAAIANVARWNGTAWAAMGSFGPLQSGHTLLVRPNGDLLAATSGLACVYRWHGAWQPVHSVYGLGLGISSIHGLCVDAAGDLTVVGDFHRTTQANYSRRTSHVARFVAGQPQPFGTIDAPVRAVGFTASGAALATGPFGPWQTGGLDVWNGTVWTPYHPLLGAGAALAGLANGAVLMAGSFTLSFSTGEQYFSAVVATPTTLGHIAGPFGSTWDNDGTAIARMPDGSFLLACSLPTVGWFAMPLDPNGVPVFGSSVGFTGPPPSAMVASPAGEVFAACGDKVLRRTVTTWVPLGGTFDAVCRSLCLTAAGDLVVGGDFTAVGGTPVARIARWNGVAWQTLGLGCAGPVHDVIELPNGDLLAGGLFASAGGVPVANLARWNGTVWSDVNGGTNGRVNDLQLGGDGTVWVGGEFRAVGGMFGCGYVARLVPTCPAMVSSYGVGCVGSGGANVLEATSLPWIGSTFASRATGMPTPGLALAVNGLAATSVPLPLLLPIGQSGCDLSVMPVVLDVFLPNQGAAEVRLALPLATVLVGQSIFQQVVGIELAGSGAMIALTSSNGLALTVGSF